jgi:hypothetical protein
MQTIREFRGELIIEGADKGIRDEKYNILVDKIVFDLVDGLLEIKKGTDDSEIFTKNFKVDARPIRIGNYVGTDHIKIQRALADYGLRDLTPLPKEVWDDPQKGYSAYEVWLNAGHEGTEADFFEFLKGQDGKDGITPTLYAETRTEVTGTEIDFTALRSGYKVLTEDTTFTIVNPIYDKVVMIAITGNFALNLPASCPAISGEYDPEKTNYFFFYCENAEAGSENYVVSIVTPQD